MAMLRIPKQPSMKLNLPKSNGNRIFSMNNSIVISYSAGLGIARAGAAAFAAGAFFQAAWKTVYCKIGDSCNRGQIYLNVDRDYHVNLQY